MKQAYMAPEMEVIDMNMETPLMALSAAGSLDGHRQVGWLKEKKPMPMAVVAHGVTYGSNLG